ncbi:hypothetical protein GCM10010267_43160 [Streptomyces griseorubens]|nr:hypothetical protein GCM10010267_43160 [Streptomyces griseorubens]
MSRTGEPPTAEARAASRGVGAGAADGSVTVMARLLGLGDGSSPQPRKPRAFYTRLSGIRTPTAPGPHSLS